MPHSEICGYNAYLQLPAAYRSLSRPSSAPDAKAFTLRSFSLELSYFVLLELLEFLKQILGCCEKVSLLHYFTFREIVSLPILERPLLISKINNCPLYLFVSTLSIFLYSVFNEHTSLPLCGNLG